MAFKKQGLQMTGKDQEVNSLEPAAAKAIVQIARDSLELFLRKDVILHPNLPDLPEQLIELGSSFVTFTNHGKLRGCMGNTDASYPLAQDVARNAVSAASRDYRFPPVTVDELSEVRLEVTVMTNPSPLHYQDYSDLVRKLKPGIHGVILVSGNRKGLLLPQVWERLPDADRFLEMIARKAGIPRGELHDTPPSVAALTFEAHHYCELGYSEPGS
jgi:AmmeMemoRadiSam system protein A